MSDLTPDNVLVDAEGNVTIIDFAHLKRIAEDDLSIQVNGRRGQLGFTDGYAPPEAFIENALIQATQSGSGKNKTVRQKYRLIEAGWRNYANHMRNKGYRPKLFLDDFTLASTNLDVNKYDSFSLARILKEFGVVGMNPFINPHTSKRRNIDQLIEYLIRYNNNGVMQNFVRGVQRLLES